MTTGQVHEKIFDSIQMKLHSIVLNCLQRSLHRQKTMVFLKKTSNNILQVKVVQNN